MAGGAETQLVRDLMGKVLKKLPPAQLSRRLELAGYTSPKKPGQRYGDAAVYGWASGHGKPDVDVFLFAVKEAGLLVDPYLYGEEALRLLDPADMNARLKRLEEATFGNDVDSPTDQD